MSTANAMPEQISACLAAGMDLHVAKPIDIKRLYAAIETAMARGATMPADRIAVSALLPVRRQGRTIGRASRLTSPCQP